jgi:hypothetical protein
MAVSENLKWVMGFAKPACQKAPEIAPTDGLRKAGPDIPDEP